MPMIPTEFVCIGRRRLNGKLVVGFRLVAGDPLDVRYYALSRDMLSFRPGRIYSIHADPEGSSIRASNYQFIRMIDDEEEILRLETVSASEESLFKANKRNNEADRLETLLKTLEPLRLQYQNLPRMDKTAFELVILGALRTPVR